MAFAVPPDKTSRMLPLLKVRLELVTPEDTKVVVMDAPPLPSW